MTQNYQLVVRCPHCTARCLIYGETRDKINDLSFTCTGCRQVFYVEIAVGRKSLAKKREKKEAMFADLALQFMTAGDDGQSAESEQPAPDSSSEKQSWWSWLSAVVSAPNACYYCRMRIPTWASVCPHCTRSLR